jgi:hypothetical protein
MNLTVCSFNDILINNKKKNFIYIGTNYFQITKLKSKYNPIDLEIKLSQISSKERKPFLKWLEINRKFNNDSLQWWMTSLGSKNNAHSRLYDLLCQFKRVQIYLDNNQKKNIDIIIFCEDIFIKNFLIKNINQKLLDKKKIIINSFFIDFFILFIKSIYSLFKKFFLTFKFFFYSKITRQLRKKSLPEGEIILFHNCLSNNFKIYGGMVTCNYFGKLPFFLKKKKLKVYSLPWTPFLFYNFNFYRKISNIKNIFLPDDYLNFTDYLRLILDSYTGIFKLKFIYSYRKINLIDLIKREKIKETFELHFIFLRYISAFQKWSKNLTKITIFDHYENLQFEHPLRSLTHKKKNFQSVGYYHSLTSKEFLSYQHEKLEWTSHIKPNKIVAHSEFAKKNLSKQGVPIERIVSGPNLRSNKNNHFKKKISNTILASLSLNHNSNLEILSTLIQLNSFLQKNNVSVLIRPHPMISTKDTINLIDNLWVLPDNWHFSKSITIKEDLQKCFCLLTLTSASVFDAIKFKIPVFNINSELIACSNYLDMLPKNSTFSKSYNFSELVKVLHNLYLNKTCYDKDVKTAYNFIFHKEKAKNFNIFTKL